MLDGVATTVTFTLAPDGDGTRLHLDHAGLVDELRPQFDSGWVEKFGGLTKMLEEAL